MSPLNSDLTQNRANERRGDSRSISRDSGPHFQANGSTSSSSFFPAGRVTTNDDDDVVDKHRIIYVPRVFGSQTKGARSPILPREFLFNATNPGWRLKSRWPIPKQHSHSIARSVVEAFFVDGGLLLDVDVAEAVPPPPVPVVAAAAFVLFVADAAALLFLLEDMLPLSLTRLSAPRAKHN